MPTLAMNVSIPLYTPLCAILACTGTTLNFTVPYICISVDSTCNRNEYQQYFLGVKAVGAYGWQPYHLHKPSVLKSGSLKLLEPSGPVQACNGISTQFLFVFQYFSIYILALSKSFCITRIKIVGDEAIISFELSITGYFLSVWMSFRFKTFFLFDKFMGLNFRPFIYRLRFLVAFLFCVSEIMYCLK